MRRPNEAGEPGVQLEEEEERRPVSLEGRTTDRQFKAVPGTQCGSLQTFASLGRYNPGHCEHHAGSMFSFSEHTDASAITQSLLWLPLPALVVPIFQRQWHLNKARQGGGGRTPD